MRAIVSHLLCVGAGILAGFLLANVPALAVQKEINAGHILSAFATIVVALIINHVYNRSASTRSMERQLLLERVKDISVAQTDAYHAFLGCPIGTAIPKQNSDSIGLAERRLSNAVHSLEVALGYCDVKTGKSFEAVKEARFDLKRALTDDPFPSGSFTVNDASNIQSAFTRLRDETTKLTFAVNKACH